MLDLALIKRLIVIVLFIGVTLHSLVVWFSKDEKLFTKILSSIAMTMWLFITIYGLYEF